MLGASPSTGSTARPHLPGTSAPCSCASRQASPSSAAVPPHPAVSHSHQPLATGISGRKPQQMYLFCQLSWLLLFYQFITLSLTVPIWFVRHSFPYSLLYLAHSWSATCSRRETLGTCTALLSPSHTFHVSCSPHSPPCLYLLSLLAPSEPSSSASTVPEAPQFLVEMKPGPGSPPAELVKICPLP